MRIYIWIIDKTDMNSICNRVIMICNCTERMTNLLNSYSLINLFSNYRLYMIIITNRKWIAQITQRTPFWRRCHQMCTSGYISICFTHFFHFYNNYFSVMPGKPRNASKQPKKSRLESQLRSFLLYLNCSND